MDKILSLIVLVNQANRKKGMCSNSSLLPSRVIFFSLLIHVFGHYLLHVSIFSFLASCVTYVTDFWFILNFNAVNCVVWRFLLCINTIFSVECFEYGIVYYECFSISILLTVFLKSDLSNHIFFFLFHLGEHFIYSFP